MGRSNTDWLIIWIMLSALSWPHVQGSERDALNSFLYDYAIKESSNNHTGDFYNIPLPSNFSGMELSFLRLRTRNIWNEGARFDSLVIPQKTLPWPFTERVDIVYQNLGTWSSSYYDVPNYTLIAPVIGFLAYDSNRSSSYYGLIDLFPMGNDPIGVRFPNVPLREGSNPTKRCVRFDTNGTYEFSNVTVDNSSLARKQGHFAIVAPYDPKDDKWKKMRWWIIGFGCGLTGLILIFAAVIVVCKSIKEKKIREMERVSERNESLDSIWIGRSRMPSASAVRTIPAFEDRYVP